MNVFSGNYDKEIIYWLYLDYEETRDTYILNELLKNIAPLVNLVAVGFVNKYDCEIDLISVEALEHLYFLFISDKVNDIPKDNCNHLSTFLWTVINRSFIDSLRRNKLIDNSILEKLLESNEHFCIHSRAASYKDVDIRLYLDNFKNMLFYMVRSDIRFFGIEYEACVFILSCILGFVNLSPGSAKYRYKLHSKRLDFFINYISYLIRINKSYLLKNDIE
jgi:hypothetical protein